MGYKPINPSLNKSVLITGVAASGKSAVCSELKKLGKIAYDIESMPGLFDMVNVKTGEVAKVHNNDSFEFASQHKWVCNPIKLKELIKNQPDETEYYCGISTNLEEILPIFDKIFLLIANKENTRKRLTERQSNSFGRNPEIQDWILSWKEDLENKIKSFGAEIIDANKNLDEVTNEIISKSEL